MENEQETLTDELKLGKKLKTGKITKEQYNKEIDILDKTLLFNL